MLFIQKVLRMYRGKFTNFFCLDFVSFSNHYLKYGTVASRGQPFGIGKGFLFRASPVMAILEKDFFRTFKIRWQSHVYQNIGHIWLLFS